MENFVTSSFRLGIVGGGQLGRMLALEAAKWDIRTFHLESSDEAPARIISDQFEKGSMTSYEDVVRFGKSVDVLTIESDNVNADALEHLSSLGKQVCPSAQALRIIQDKGRQRQFCEHKDLPVPSFEVYDSKKDLLDNNKRAYPFVVKTRTAGYDGKGVFLIKSQIDLQAIPDTGLLVEEKVDILKELTVIAARNAKGDIAIYPLIELFMKPDAYLVDYLIGPALVSPELQEEAERIARSLVEGLDIKGIMAIELFLDSKGRLLINECSPRPHNSGHQTIEGSFTSQYEQHLRGILNLPLGSCETKVPAGMINLLGEPDAKGDVRYQGLRECLEIPGVKLHIYGKKTVAPYRKMGHITVLNQSYEELLNQIQKIKTIVKVGV